MEISESTIGMFYISRILGLAPYRIRTISKGKLQIHRSIIFTFYSLLLIIVFTTLTYRGLLFDANSKIPVRASFRMKSATSKVVTALDVSVVVFATLTGIICGIMGLRPTQEINERLKEADETLSMYTNEIKDRRRGYILISLVFLVITIMLALDVWSWYRLAEKMKREVEENLELNIQWYIPFYGLYYILMGLHVHFAQSAVGLGRRYRRLNMALKKSFQDDDGSKSKVGIIRVASLKTVMSNNQKKTSQTNGTILINEKSALIDRLAYTHESLGKAVQNVSGAFGFTVLFMLVSCLLHLVATAYFLFLEVLSNKDSMYFFLQALWVLFHIMRLLLIVEPCHITTEEAKKTISLICENERYCKDELTQKTMKKFWQQLLSDKTSFSACGMCKIDRQILTSFSGAIATYLVILIQFQKTDG